MLKFAIVDDDKQELAVLSNTITTSIGKHSPLVQVDSFSNPLDVEAAVYDVLFLDIDMPQINGLVFAKETSQTQHPPLIIFITHKAEQVYDVFSIRAFDFIRKEEFLIKIDTVIQRLFAYLIKKKKNILIKTTVGDITLSIYDIMYCENIDHACYIHTDNTTYKSWITLSKIEKIINSITFIPINKSTLINMSYIAKVNGDKITLKDNSVLYISRRKTKLVKQQFENYIFNNI